MFYRQSIERCLQGEVNAAAMEGALSRLAPALDAFKGRNNPQAKALLDLPAAHDDLPAIATLADEICGTSDHLLIAGAGGAGLSGRVLTAMASAMPSPSLHFLDNIDPDAIAACLARIEPAKCFFLIISKSGMTVETIGQFCVLLDHVRATLGEKARERFLVITSAGDNPLRQMADEYGIRTLDYHPHIGGRFSVLINVGLLPAAVMGLDMKRLRAGARSVVSALDAAAAPRDLAPAMGAALQYAFLQKGRNISVMLPYSERLSGLSSWYRQSWAESLGKGGKGSTPIRAVGTTDQHSQLQLYLDGPRDKLFHLITLNRAGSGQRVNVPDYPSLSYLKGRTTGDIMQAEQQATLATLTGKGCPVRLIELDQLREEELGALLMHFTLEIMFMAHLLGVNPFDQPAVEEGKALARQYLKESA